MSSSPAGTDHKVQPQGRGQPALLRGFGQLPLSFEANQGQVDGQVKYLARGKGYTLFLTETEAVLALRSPTQKTEKRTK